MSELLTNLSKPEHKIWTWKFWQIIFAIILVAVLTLLYQRFKQLPDDHRVTVGPVTTLGDHSGVVIGAPKEK